MKPDIFFKKILTGTLIIIGLSIFVLVVFQIFGRRVSKRPPTIAPPRVVKEKPAPTPTSGISLQKRKPAGEATLSLIPNQGGFSQGGVYKVAVQLNTGGKPATGIDVILNYDPAKLEVLEVIPGNFFATYFRKGEDKAKKKIYLSAAIFSKTEHPFIGQGIFGTIKFKALNPGKANVSFDYISQATSDSNVTAEGGLDFLTNVIDGEYQIQ